MRYLTLYEKICIVFGCSVLVMITASVIICWLFPKQWLCCRKRPKKEPCIVLKDVLPLRTDQVMTTEICAIQMELDQKLSRMERWNLLPSKLNRNDVFYSSTISHDSGRDSIDSDAVFSSSNAPSPRSSLSGSLDTCPEEKTPFLCLSLQFHQSTSHNESDYSHLIVYIEKAGDLPRRCYVNNCDPCVSVLLEKVSRSIRGKRRENLASFNTSIIYHCLNPVFQQTFTIQTNELKDCHLVAKVQDNDRFYGLAELGYVKIPLEELGLESGSKVQLTRYLMASQSKDKGEISIGLSFLPTSQRIMVQIDKLNRMPKFDDKYQCLIKIYLLNESGRVMKRRKTTIFPYDNSIEFNEAFNLDVDIDRWEKSVILIVISRFINDAVSRSESTDGLHQPDHEETRRISPHYLPSGKIALGKQVTGYGQRIHWNSAFQNPRRTIVQWHALD